MIRCPKCKKFARVTSYTINGLGDIGKVDGRCKKHGKVKVLWDDYDEIVSEDNR